ncbi:MAG: formyltetrahydrofolate deformylase [Bacteroidetes bacterium MED-G21]|nr:MAG: formyltetrahydrofolate deformylase [Bacteroidetes bacterium MED-G21]
MSTATMLIYCPDEKGIILSVTNYISANNGNIVDLDQHVDSEQKIFFMRVEWTLSDFNVPRENIGTHFGSEVAQKYQMQYTVHFRDEKIRMALMVSKMDHCFNDILSRYKSGEWNVEIPLIISNHPEMEETANRFGIPYHYIPVSKQTKVEQEKKQLQLLSDNKIEFVVLARYMQILSENFIKDYSNPIINIHHSFLPAFPGAKPYHSAHERGVKIIGATSHYVTKDLDAGPIIEQSTANISHKDRVEDLVRKGRDIEKVVLSRAIWYHVNRRILSYGNRTIIFD